MDDPRRRRAIRLAVLAGVAVAGCSGGRGPAARPAVTGTMTVTTTVATAPPATTTSVPSPPTPADPGSLPQTGAVPTAADPLFQAHIRDLWRAVVDGMPAQGLPFFFPLGAYIQVKAISDPVHDYQTRLIADYEQDITALHARLGSSAATAAMSGVAVPDAAQWILPGVEYNKGSYWRVYGTRVSYVAGGVPGSFEVASMISWRGEWYVVHLSSIR